MDAEVVDTRFDFADVDRAVLKRRDFQRRGSFIAASPSCAVTVMSPCASGDGLPSRSTTSSVRLVCEFGEKFGGRDADFRVVPATAFSALRGHVAHCGDLRGGIAFVEILTVKMGDER